MTKEKLINLLKEAHYHASVEQGIVMVQCTVKNESEFKKALSELKDFINKNDYSGSFGIRAISEKKLDIAKEE